MIPIACNEKALHHKHIYCSIFFSESVQCLHEIQPMKCSQLLQMLLKTIPAFKTGHLSFPRHSRAVLVLLSFVPLLPAVCLPFCLCRSSRPILITAPAVYLYSSRSGWGDWQWVLLKEERQDGRNVCIISPDEHVSKQSIGGLWSSKSDHFALKSADAVFSSHP